MMDIFLDRRESINESYKQHRDFNRAASEHRAASAAHLWFVVLVMLFALGKAALGGGSSEEKTLQPKAGSAVQEN